jgi:excisionase family DNA binding protein
MSHNELLSPRETIRLLKIPKSRLYYLVLHKQIPFIRIGASLRFDPTEIHKWLELKKVAEDPLSIPLPENTVEPTYGRNPAPLVVESKNPKKRQKS